jgi:hypothetical protein
MIDCKTLTVAQVLTDPIINNNGVAGVVANFECKDAVTGEPATGKGLFNITQRLLLGKVGDTIGEVEPTGIRNNSLKDNDGLVFLADFNGGQVLISTQRGVLVKTGDTLDDGKTLGTIGKPRLTDSGEVIFVADYDSSGSGLFSTKRGFIIGNGDTVDKRTLSCVGEEQVNDNGVVAFGDSLKSQRVIIVAEPSYLRASIRLRQGRTQPF